MRRIRQVNTGNSLLKRRNKIDRFPDIKKNNSAIEKINGINSGRLSCGAE